MAMNMPTHRPQKATQVPRAGARDCRFASSSLNERREAPAQRGVFLADPDAQHDGVEEREQDGKRDETEGEGKGKNFSRNNAIVRMSQKR